MELNLSRSSMKFFSSEVVAQSRLGKHCIDLELFLHASRAQFNEKFQGAIPQNAALHDFQFIKTLGMGAFGVVIMANHKIFKRIYAIKILEKSSIVHSRQTSHVLDEIRVANALRFPFCVNMTYFFIDNVYLYMVFPYMNGGDMFKHLREKGRFSEDLSRFYASQVVLALEYLHKMGLIYRDVKPENILIDNKGYLKLVDFGFCKKVGKNRTYTMCGTPEYLAPEVILNKGYTRAVDFWSLGILIYEMNAGIPPFTGSNHMSIYEKICNDPLKIPGHFTVSLVKLLMGLISKDTTQRVGNLKDGIRGIKVQDWFDPIDWDLILTRQVEPEFNPGNSVDPSSSKNFDKLPPIVLRQSPLNEYAEHFQSLYAPIMTTRKRTSEPINTEIKTSTQSGSNERKST